MVKSQERSVKSQKPAFALRSCSGSGLLTLGSRLSASPRGITLVELLITLLIISILASLILGVAMVAAETAREHHTRHVVARLHTLLNEHYESYKSRRVRLIPDQEETIVDFFANPAQAPQRGQAIAEARLYALRELMLMEMPDRWSDVTLRRDANDDIGNPTYFDAPITSLTDPSNSSSEIYRTPLAATYLRRFLHLRQQSPDVADENGSAECLYMIITLACGEGESRSLFGEKTIGDTDGDGAPEFVDGWDNPIGFIRWAPGFDSQIQLNANTLGQQPRGTNPGANEWLSQSSADRDPFDIFRRDRVAFRLVPHIYSLGRDEGSGINDDPEFVTWPLPTSKMPLQLTTATTARDQFIQSPRLTSFDLSTQANDGLPASYLGTHVDAEATDNIHNHLQGLR